MLFRLHCLLNSLTSSLNSANTPFKRHIPFSPGVLQGSRSGTRRPKRWLQLSDTPARELDSEITQFQSHQRRYWSHQVHAPSRNVLIPCVASCLQKDSHATPWRLTARRFWLADGKAAKKEIQTVGQRHSASQPQGDPIGTANGGGCRPVAGGPAGKTLTDCARPQTSPRNLAVHRHCGD
jgi:hypothetical protein